VGCLAAGDRHRAACYEIGHLIAAWRRILAGGLAKPLPWKGDFYSTRHAWMMAGGPIATALATDL
jgi:hypothetical protein